MNDKADICVIGAGRIGLPWAAVLADSGHMVTCVDVDKDVVDTICRGDAPFDEPGLDDLVGETVAEGQLTATTKRSSVENANVVGVTLNAPADQIDSYIDILTGYCEFVSPSQTVINRTTLPVSVIDRVRAEVAEAVGTSPTNLDYVTFPERLAEGRAIEELKSLPKIVGTNDGEQHAPIEVLLNDLAGNPRYVDHKTAMFIKLIDNAYRDARFAIANQFALAADRLGVDAHRAIAVANDDYPRNDIPTPGTVGGKCLTKDPYFLTEEWVDDLPADLFLEARAANDAYTNLVVNRVLELDPSSIAVLGRGFKRDLPDEIASPTVDIISKLKQTDINVKSIEPVSLAFRDRDATLKSTISACDVVLLAVDHTYFRERETMIRELADGPIVDVWGAFEPGNDVKRVGTGSFSQTKPTLTGDNE
ncbi:nucleotide sugar dehydrogenase [Halorubrum ezzemoulense]|uniref:nucleotide sugar dehydrogenase n=1 Tax=Halorubrum ezzemoulense TaxID=337243 RepID=UPI00232F7968|nr:nucleotide sugar dehydrogenase [Halorubrum ezzemoulense]MDB2250573.1 nucleotide sugar dehydrogenase [Halorubrum ezzemoulense]MDB2285977.1 nucleotide sugar dehydrogenase [Halorubrum ezzemoulense]